MDYIRTEADGQLALTQYAPGRKILIKIARNIYHYPLKSSLNACVSSFDGKTSANPRNSKLIFAFIPSKCTIGDIITLPFYLTCLLQDVVFLKFYSFTQKSGYAELPVGDMKI